MAVRNEKFMALVLPTGMSTRSLARSKRVLLGAVELFQLVRLRGEGTHDTDAAEILIHHPDL